MKDSRKYIRKIAKLPILALYHLNILLTGVDKKSIVFESNLGRNYSGNPRSIYEEMVRRGLDKKYRCYFILEDTGIWIPGAARKVKRISLAYFKVFAKAGFWVSDTRMPRYLVKRKGMFYIQTWHGTPLKRLALDMFDVRMEGEDSLEAYRKEFITNVKTWDYLISQNSYSTGIFRRAFAFDKEILEIGYPRNDILINRNNPQAIHEIKERLGLPADRKIILYAPTWRDNEHSGHQRYKLNVPVDFTYMENQLSPEYFLIVKAHYLVGEQLKLDDYQDFIRQFGPESDIAELYLAADILVTDYSSVMFDYSLLRRPMIFYTYDLDNYKNNLRGFYFDLTEEAPGPLVTTTRQLVEKIKDPQPEKYRSKREAFFAKYNHADDGRASEKVVDLIETVYEDF